MPYNSKKSYYAVLLFVVTLLITQFASCKREKGNKSKVLTKQQVAFKIETSSDTVIVNEYLKSFAFLEKPYFKNSGMMVYVENDDDYTLQKDLSNELDINMDIFPNLNHDAINQKWMKGNDFYRTTVFGRKFKSIGKDTIRGYILEYQNKDLSIDSVFKSEKVKRYYFEKEIYVKSAMNK